MNLDKFVTVSYWWLLKWNSNAIHFIALFWGWKEENCISLVYCVAWNMSKCHKTSVSLTTQTVAPLPLLLCHTGIAKAATLNKFLIFWFLFLSEMRKNPDGRLLPPWSWLLFWLFLVLSLYLEPQYQTATMWIKGIYLCVLQFHIESKKKVFPQFFLGLWALLLCC